MRGLRGAAQNFLNEHRANKKGLSRSAKARKLQDTSF
jgi:hypothetical protein